MKILIVDDSKAMRMIIKRILRQTEIGDHSTVEAENGQAGLEQLENEHPDLVISDWNMPEMDGIEFLRALRENGNNVKFGFVTTEASEKMRNIATQAGANFLIAKPFTPESFEHSIKPILNL